MRFSVIILVFIFSGKAFAQNVHQLRFIWIGQQTKPIGTIVICVEKRIYPDNHTFDYKVGENVQTDMKTFRFLDKLCRKSKYLDHDTKDMDLLAYQILHSDSTSNFLIDPDVIPFFNEMKALVIKFKLDKKVLIPFERRFSN